MSFCQCLTQHLTRIAFFASHEWDPTSVVIAFWPIVAGFICQNKSIMMGSSLILWTDAGANCGGFLGETINIGWRRLMWRIFMMQICSCRFITSWIKYVITYECPKCFRGWLWCTVGFTWASEICITHFSNKLLLIFSSSQSSGWTDFWCMPNVWWNARKRCSFVDDHDHRVYAAWVW